MSLAAVRRRWWLIALCVVAVAALAYGVAELRARTSTAEAVVLLDPGVIVATPVAVDQAVRLAAEYAAVIPQDDALLRAVALQLGTPVRGSVVASNPASSSLVRVGFRAISAAGAVRGARAVAAALTAGRPASPTFLTGSLRTVRVPSSAQVLPRARKRAPRSFLATAVLVTSAGGGPTGPGYGDQAKQLAPSFAASIPEDAGVLGLVARRLGVSTDEAEHNTSVKNDRDTAVLRLRYRGRGEARAERGASALAAAVTGPTPASASIRPREFRLVRVGKASSPSSNPAVTLPIGALLGLCLGIVLVLALERADPRVDDARMLEEELRCPVYQVDAVTPSLAGALLERWRALGGGRQPTVALIPASEDVQQATAGLAQRLSEHGVTADDASERLGGPLRLVLAREPAGDPAGASVAARSDVAVLVVAQGRPLSGLRAACHALDNFEVPVQWALLLPRSARRRLEEGAAVIGEPSEQPTSASAV